MRAIAVLGRRRRESKREVESAIYILGRRAIGILRRKKSDIYSSEEQ